MWNKVFWSDETRIEHFALQFTTLLYVALAASCSRDVSLRGRGKLIRPFGNMDGAKKRSFPEENLLEAAKRPKTTGEIQLQLNNHHKPTTGAAIYCFISNMFEWPGESGDPTGTQ